MKEEKIIMTYKEAVAILERLRFEAEFNEQTERQKALEMAIEAMKELKDIQERLTDDGK
jgi:hypothetical protein